MPDPPPQRGGASTHRAQLASAKRRRRNGNMPDATWATLDLAINEDLHLLSTEGNRPSLPSLLRPERPPERKRRETGGGNPTLKPGKKREKVGERMSPNS